jgi:hypothetical protein
MEGIFGKLVFNASGIGGVPKCAINGGIQSFSAVLSHQNEIRRRIFQASAWLSDVYNIMAKHRLTVS